MCPSIGLAHDDVPMPYSLAVDMLLEAGDLETLTASTLPLLELPVGQRFRLLHGQLLRLKRTCRTSRRSDCDKRSRCSCGWGPAFWGPRAPESSCATALAVAGDTASSAAEAAQQPNRFLRDIGGDRALGQLDSLRRAAPAVGETPVCAPPGRPPDVRASVAMTWHAKGTT